MGEKTSTGNDTGMMTGVVQQRGNSGGGAKGEGAGSEADLGLAKPLLLWISNGKTSGD